ncbi:phage head closure protein [Pseudoduganella sp. FT26W]|uniref:Phage head closure protein n=1 Tax=Duganella aquatilis TaxID=2666082 RepID=A0A844DFG8_9BURK|nr:phage head closure protein [Duganella aquatilis]MRW86784.1 phage head closure protein [Duganella aquatilis]
MAAFSITLNRRVQLMKPGGSDELGQPDPNASTLIGPAWANIRNMKGAEAVRAGAMSASVHCSIRLRFREDLAEGMQVIHGNTRYTIRSVLPDEEKRRHVDLVCEVSP